MKRVLLVLLTILLSTVMVTPVVAIAVDNSNSTVKVEENLNYGKAKSYMGIDSITCKSSKQYKLKPYYYVDEFNFCRFKYGYRDAYVLAVGTFYGKVGSVFQRWLLYNCYRRRSKG